MKKLWMLVLLMSLSACGNLKLEIETSSSGSGSPAAQGESAVVKNIIDGDTIDVVLNGETMRVRYVGVNTPERDESCYSDASAANRAMVAGKTVRLMRDTSDTDRYGRLLRYVYVDNVFVNAELIKQGYGESVLYEPDDQFHSEFVEFERQAARAGRGCHPTGIFDDGSTTR